MILGELVYFCHVLRILHLNIFGQIQKQINVNMIIKTKSVITCPNCGYQKEEEMPTDACQ